MDDYGNYLCIKESEDCPVNDIQVTKSMDEELEKLGYSHIIINDEKYLYYTNTSDKPVITRHRCPSCGSTNINDDIDYGLECNECGRTWNASYGKKLYL